MNHPYAQPRREPAPDAGRGTRALCRVVPDKSVFFPRLGAVGLQDVATAKAICSSCPILASCREDSLRLNPSDGVFGGMTPQERRRERVARARAAKREQVAA